MADDTCPKCANPRQSDAVDCPYCGVVYRKATPAGSPAVRSGPGEGAQPDRPEPGRDRVASAAARETPRAAPAETFYGGPSMPVAHDVYAGPVPSPRPAGAKPGAAVSADEPELFETPLTRMMPLALFAAGLLYLLAQAFLTQHVANGVESVQAAYEQFRLLSGLDAPPGQRKGMVLTAAGRKIVLLDERADGEPEDGELELSVFAYSQGSLAGNATGDELLGIVERVLERFVGVMRKDPRVAKSGVEISWWRISDRQYRLGAHPATLRLFAFGGSRGGQRLELGRVACIATTGADGRPLLIGVVGKGPRVTAALRPILRSLGR